MKTKEEYKQYKKDWLKKRSQKGLCTQCGKTLQLQDNKLCQKCRERDRASSKEWARRNPQKAYALQKAYRYRLRENVLKHYGSKCVCCGETHIEFLTIDHKNNDGNEQKRFFVGYGTRFYVWIKRNNYPDDLQILCWNCNLAKAIYGVCPHSG